MKRTGKGTEKEFAQGHYNWHATRDESLNSQTHHGQVVVGNRYQTGSSSNCENSNDAGQKDTTKSQISQPLRRPLEETLFCPGYNSIYQSSFIG